MWYYHRFRHLIWIEVAINCKLTKNTLQHPTVLHIDQLTPSPWPSFWPHHFLGKADRWPCMRNSLSLSAFKVIKHCGWQFAIGVNTASFCEPEWHPKVALLVRMASDLNHPIGSKDLRAWQASGQVILINVRPMDCPQLTLGAKTELHYKSSMGWGRGIPPPLLSLIYVTS